MYLWIDNILEGVKDTYNTSDIYELYDFLNIKLFKTCPINPLLNGNEAFYYRNYFNNEIVVLKNNLNTQYEKFILAHELGHALLHTNICEAAFNKDLINVCKIEKQASYFAFKLLNSDIDKIAFDGFTIEQIASSLYIPIKHLKNMTDKILGY